MCLELNESSKVKIADKDIRVFKVLTKVSKNRAESPYYDARYKNGEVKTIKRFSGISNNYNYNMKYFQNEIPKNVESVERGLHSYKRINAAMSELRWHGYSIIVEAFIPKGTQYIIGKNNEVVSLQLRIGKAIRGLKDLKDAFNAK